MKLILAFIPQNHLQRILDALVDHRVHGLTISEARGFGQEFDSRHPEYREFADIDMPHKLRLEVACHDEEVETVLTALYEAGHTGLQGDGKVFVLPINDALRLKTGERGKAALGPTEKPG